MAKPKKKDAVISEVEEKAFVEAATAEVPRDLPKTKPPCVCTTCRLQAPAIKVGALKS